MEKMKGRAWAGLLAGAFLAAAFTPTKLGAQVVDEDEGWRFAATPWLWLVNLSGSLGVLGREVDVEVDTDEIFDALEFGWMSHWEVGKGRAGFFAQPIIAKLGSDGTVQVSTVGPTDAEVDLDMTMLDLGGAYRVGGPFEVVGGVRYFGLDTTIELEGLGEEGRDVGWWNGFIGGRVRRDFAERWGVLVHADIGFGESETNYMTQGVLQYRFSPRWGVDFGYKWLHDEVAPEDRRIDWESDMYGAVVGVTFRR
jgi:hypothetical protein